MVGAVTKLFGRKGKAKDSIPELQNHRPDLLSHRGDDVYETHPSEHSEVNVINSPSARKMALARGKAINKRLQEDQDAVSSGAADGWQALLVEIRSRPKDGHHSAFSASELKHTCDQLDVQAAVMGQCAMVSSLVIHPGKTLTELNRTGFGITWQVRWGKYDDEGKSRSG